MNVGGFSQVLPAWAGDFRHVSEQLLNINHLEVMITALPREILYPSDGFGSILRGFDDYVQATFYFCRIVCFKE
jgi:hypothetical protein